MIIENENFGVSPIPVVFATPLIDFTIAGPRDILFGPWRAKGYIFMPSAIENGVWARVSTTTGAMTQNPEGSIGQLLDDTYLAAGSELITDAILGDTTMGAIGDIVTPISPQDLGTYPLRLHITTAAAGTGGFTLTGRLFIPGHLVQL